ncbi:MAG: hypothetical protein EBU05_08320, partial [Chitinophagia bacterium]|nr:hypothetical protein [Chitinophagia bacterium]
APTAVRIRSGPRYKASSDNRRRLFSFEAAAQASLCKLTRMKKAQYKLTICVGKALGKTR